MVLSVEIEHTSKNASTAIKTAQRHRLEDALTKGWSVSQEKVPEDEGMLRFSGFGPTWRSDGSIAFGYRANHAEPMEYGTAPFHPPVQPLVEWSKRVTGDPGLGYYVALHKIPTEGIDAQPYMRPAAEATKQWLQNNEFGKYLEREL